MQKLAVAKELGLGFVFADAVNVVCFYSAERELATTTETTSGALGRLLATARLVDSHLPVSIEGSRTSLC
eukprot:3437715-Pyramimonas_sp.AAC.1